MNNELIRYLIDDINKCVNEDIKIMEICGTHTHQIAKLGLKSLLSERIQMISGPGCPVCVTDENYIDTAIYLLRNHPITIATFGDLVRVRGSQESLEDLKSNGYHVLIMHSPLDIIKLAEQNNDVTYILLGVGFETTAPILALTIKTAFERGIKNLYFLTSLKLMNPILHYILMNKSNNISGFICPGHVATIKGSSYFTFISKDYHKPAVVSGFEALDIVSGIQYLVKQITKHEYGFENYYKRCVADGGNSTANKLIQEVFKCSDTTWRGIGKIHNSALIIKNEYQCLDASKVYGVDVQLKNRNEVNCQCHDVLLGNKNPRECKLFSISCNPITPHGPCMVSKEGSCAIAYKFMEDE